MKMKGFGKILLVEKLGDSCQCALVRFSPTWGCNPHVGHLTVVWGLQELLINNTKIKDLDKNIIIIMLKFT